MTTQIDELLEFRKDHLGWPVSPGLVEEFGIERALAALKERKRLIEEADKDPLRFGYEPKIWDKVDQHIADLRSKFPKGVIKICIFGGNRSSKTRKCANLVNRALKAKDESRWWCCDSTEAQSRANQMRLIWEQFPPEWKGLDRTEVTDIRYNVADGFPKNMFVCPNKSECHFKFYSMALEALPGSEFDGIWADELIPLSWVQSLTYRLVNRNGLMLISFTPEFGWNETFGYFYEGAQTLEDEEALLLPRIDNKGRTVGFERVPRVMQCADPMARIIFFHSSDNPYGNPEAIEQEEKAKGNNRDSIKIRYYGLCERAHKVAFPMFNRKTHVITEGQFNNIA